jgi:hypothetical protein
MTFHKLDCTEYMRSGCKLHDKMLQTLAITSSQSTRLARSMTACRSISSRKFARKQSKRCTANWKSNTRASCAILPTSAGAKGSMHDTTMATILTVFLANASSTCSVMMAVATMTRATTRGVPPSARTRTSSPVAYTASVPITRTTITMLTCVTKGTPSCAQTTRTTTTTQARQPLQQQLLHQ